MSFLTYLMQIALLIRLPNSFTVMSNVVAAYFIGTAANVNWESLCILLGSSLCFYHGGIVLNDCLDIREDRRNNVQRPLTLGLIERNFAIALASYLLLFGLLLLIVFDVKTQLMGVAVVVCVLAYNFSSRSGLLGCVLMGLCRGVNWLLILTAVGADKEYFYYGLLVGLYVTALTFLSRDEHYANRPYLLLVSIFILLLGATLFLFNLDGSSPYFLVKIAVFLLGLTLLSIQYVSLFKQYNPESIGKVVKTMILGMIPLDASLLFIAGYPVVSLCVLLLIIPSRLLAKRMYVT